MHLCAVQAAQQCFSPFSVGWGQQAEVGLEGTSSFRCNKALLSVCGHQLHLCSTGFCAMWERDPVPRLYLKGWAHDFNTTSKFMSWGFKNALVTWRCPWNVSVIQHCSHYFYQQHPEMEQLNTHYEQGHGLYWLEQGPEHLPEIFHLAFYSRVWACPLCKGALPWSLGWSTMFMCREAAHIRCGGGGKLLRPIRLLISDLRDSSSKSCFARISSFTVSLVLSFLSVKWEE